MSAHWMSYEADQLERAIHATLSRAADRAMQREIAEAIAKARDDQMDRMGVVWDEEAGEFRLMEAWPWRS